MNKELLRLAIPNIISNISVPLLGTVDIALMGHLSGLHLGAVGVGSMIFNFLYWNFGFLRMGTTGMTAQAFGKKQAVEIIQILGRALLLAMFFAGLFFLFQYPLGEWSFYLMNVSAQQKELVREYFYIRIWAAPASLGLYAMMGWFFGMQNAFIPLVITIASNVVNIVISFLLVQNYHMGVNGVALGTVIAQYAGLLLSFLFFFLKYKSYLSKFQKNTLLAWASLKQFLQINRDIFIRTLCLSLSFAFFYSKSASFGESILAVNVILLQFLNWMSYGVDGFAFASESMVGKYKGAKDSSKLHRAIRLSFQWGMGLALIYSLAYWLFGDVLLSLFTNEADLITMALPFMIWMVIYPLLSTPCYIWDGVFIGLTASKSMRNSMLLAFVIYLLSYWLLKPYGNNGLWMALLIFMMARGIFQAILFKQKGILIK